MNDLGYLCRRTTSRIYFYDSSYKGFSMSDTLTYVIRDNLYVNLTDRCTLACQFCPKYQHDSFEVHEYDLTLNQRPEAAEIIKQIGDPAQYQQIVFCGYGEPTLRLKVLLNIASYIKANHGSVRINTDGLANLVHKKNVLPMMVGLVDALSISMNAQNETVYIQHCKPALNGAYQAMLDFIALAPDYVNDVTATAIDGLAGVDIEACEQLAIERAVKFKKRMLDEVG